MSKFKISFFVFLFIGVNSMAQDKYLDVIKLQANLFAEATIKNDFKKIVKFTYPELVEIINKDTLLNKLSNDMVSMKEEGLRYKKITFETPQKITYLAKNYYVIPQKIVKYNSSGEFHIKTYLFVVSNNKGENWYFLTSKQFIKYQKQLLPGLEQKYKFPTETSIFTLNKKFSSFDKPN